MDNPAEKESNMISATLKALLQYIEPMLRRAVHALVEHRPMALGLAALLLVIAGWLEYESWARADFYQRTVEESLARRTENTPQTYKGIESLILSNAEAKAEGGDTDFKQLVQHARFSPEFASEIYKLDKAFSREVKDPPPQFEIVKSDLSGMPKRQQDAIVTEDNKIGFLFLPVRLLHADPSIYGKAALDATIISAQMIGLKNDKGAQSCGKDASPICDDVIVSRQLVAEMKAATTIRVTSDALDTDLDLQPTQVYYITENGINRIVSKDHNDDASFYRNQFRASTVFPARPYYVGAFEKVDPIPGTLLQDRDKAPPLQQEQLGNYFYVSEPYLDIGGNGIVITLARAVEYQGHSDGAICFDLKLTGDHALGAKLRDLVDKLEGEATPVTCKTTAFGAPECSLEDKSKRRLVRSLAEFTAKVQNATNGHNLSDVVGAISFFGTVDGQKPLSSASFWDIPSMMHADDEVRFAVPLEPPKVLDPTKEELSLRFLAVDLNVGSYLQKTAAMGFIGLLLLACAITTGIVAWAGDVRKTITLRQEKQDLHQALSNVSEVMMEANTPYARLDASDHIVDGNVKLAEFFGFPPTLTGLERIKGTRFEDLIATVSLGEYHKVQDLRKQGQPVKPYELYFKVSGRQVMAKVVSSVVPASQDRSGSLPETFGLLIAREAKFRRKGDIVSPDVSTLKSEVS
jgi:hypothetical protein